MIRRELGSRGQDLLVNCSSQMQLISRLLFTQYGIYMELFLLFWLSRVLGTSTFSKRDEYSGVTCACTCPKRRNINVVIQDTCTLSSSVNKCITICTPSIYLVVRLANPFTYLVSDAGTVKDSKSRHNLLVRRQEYVLLLSLSLFYRYLYRCCIASYAIAMAFLYTSSLHASI